jgi:hypothetical protein
VLLETCSYDNESRLVIRQETQSGATVVLDTLSFDARNRPLAIYRAPTEAAVESALETFGASAWGARYPAVRRL